MINYYIGIDPGGSGGITIIDSDRSYFNTLSMPDTLLDIWEWFRDGVAGDLISNRCYCIMERVGGFIKGNPAPGSAMFKFGMSYGALQMALIAAEIPFETVTPQHWQKTLAILARDTKSEPKSAFKRRLRERAVQLFPSHAKRITLATADSILLAEYARRHFSTPAPDPPPVRI